jgi:hypothetical protein
VLASLQNRARAELQQQERARDELLPAIGGGDPEDEAAAMVAHATQGISACQLDMTRLQVGGSVVVFLGGGRGQATSVFWSQFLFVSGPDNPSCVVSQLLISSCLVVG